METTRQNKISRLIQKELADIFQKKPDPVSGKTDYCNGGTRNQRFVAGPRLSEYFPFGKCRPNAERNKQHTAKVRGLLGLRVGKQLRIIPAWNFSRRQLDYADNIDRLLKQ
jgi:ribosome-binding factor A